MNFSKLLGPEKKKKPERAPCAWSVRFRELGRENQARHAFHAAKCRVIGEDGMEITSLIPLTPKRFVLVNLDFKTLETAVPVKNILTFSDACVLTEVKRRHLNLETGLFEAELKFIEASRAEEFEAVFKQIPA